MRTLLNAKIWLGLLALACLAPAAQSACTNSLSTTQRTHGYGATSNSITVYAEIGCDWDVTNTNSWLTVLSGAPGSGTGVVAYAVAGNPIIVGRTGLVFIAGLTLTIRQDPFPCNYSTSPTNRTHGYGGISPANPVTVSATSNCFWMTSTTNSWLSIVGAGSGSGGGSFQYNVLFNPTPVQRTGYVSVADRIFSVSQHAAPCFYELSPTNRSHGHAGSTGLVNVTVTPNCTWFVDNTNSWITITVNPTGTNTGSFGYNVAPNPNNAPRVGTFKVWDEVFGVFQQPAPCSNSFSLVPTSSSPGADPETNTVTLNGAGGCAWEAVNTNSWISVTPTNGVIGVPNGVNSAVLTWSVTANADSVGRTGVVVIAGKDFTIRQNPTVCVPSLSPTNRTHGYGAASNSVTLNLLSSCAWSIVNTNPWITIVSPTSGSGTAFIGYTVAQNTNVLARSGTVLIGGASFSLTQLGLGCAVDLSPTNRNHGHGLGTNSVSINVAAGCDWSVVNTNSWLTIVTATNGTGSNSITYIVAANPTTTGRSGVLNINEQLVTISQNPAPCSPSASPSSCSHNASQETNSLNIAAAIGCNWTIENTNSWITLLSSPNGSGSNVVSYFVAPNLDLGTRAGTLNINGDIVSVTQSGVTCNYRISPTNRTHGAGANANYLTMNVSNPCPWSVVNTNPWITILSETNGVGSNIVNYSISANTSPLSRSGSVVIGGAVSTITQNGVICTYTLSPTNRSHGYGVATNTFNVNVAGGCPWNVGVTSSWISIISGSNGPGNGTVTYAIEQNTNLTERISHLVVDGQTFILTQRAATCTADLTPAQRTHGYSASTGTVSVALPPACSWSVVNTNPWVSITSGGGNGNGVVNYSVLSNATASVRSGNIVIGEQIFAITQNALSCTYKLSPTNRTHGFGANTNSVNITADVGCSWSIVNTSSWIFISSPLNGVGNGSFNYSVDANFSGALRTAYITLADQVLALSQSPATNGFEFEFVSVNPAGVTTMRLAGGPPGIWELQSSSNLLNWVKVADLTNITGRVEFTTPSPIENHKFFRAVLP